MLETTGVALAKRLRQALDDARVSVAQLADEADVTVQGVYGWLKTGEIAREKLPLVARAVRRSTDWLLTGEDYITPRLESPRANYDFALIPRYDVRAAAGAGALVEDELLREPMAFRREWLAKMGFRFSSLKVVEADGDSMAPRIQAGDVLLVQTDETDVRDGKVYVIRNQELRVKRLFRRYDGQIILRSDNPVYPEESAPPEAISVVGRVVWVGGNL